MSLHGRWQNTRKAQRGAQQERGGNSCIEQRVAMGQGTITGQDCHVSDNSKRSTTRREPLSEPT